jgi:hypothetical protein
MKTQRIRSMLSPAAAAAFLVLPCIAAQAERPTKAPTAALAATQSVDASFSKSYSLQDIGAFALSSPTLEPYCGRLYDGSLTTLKMRALAGMQPGTVMLVNDAVPAYEYGKPLPGVRVGEAVAAPDLSIMAMGSARVIRFGGVWYDASLISNYFRSAIAPAGGEFVTAPQQAARARICVDSVSIGLAALKSGDLSAVASFDDAVKFVEVEALKALNKSLDDLPRTLVTALPSAVRLRSTGGVDYRYPDGLVLMAEPPPAISVSMVRGASVVFDNKKFQGADYLLSIKRGQGAEVLK